MATDKEILANEARLKRFIADLDCLCEEHGLIIDREVRPVHLNVYTKYGKKIGKIAYDGQEGEYKNHLSQTEREIRAEIKRSVYR